MNKLYPHIAMKHERKQENRSLVRQWLLAGKYLLCALFGTLLLASHWIRAIAHFVLVPYLWVPKNWQRSALSDVSEKLAHASVDLALFAIPIGIAIGFLW